MAEIDFDDGTWPPVPERRAPPNDIDRPCQITRMEGTKPCLKPALYGHRFCAHHANISSPSGPRLYKNRRASKYHGALPARLVAAYEASLDDGRLLQMREEVALLDSRIVDLLARVPPRHLGRLDHLGERVDRSRRLGPDHHPYVGVALLVLEQPVDAVGAGEHRVGCDQRAGAERVPVAPGDRRVQPHGRGLLVGGLPADERRGTGPTRQVRRDEGGDEGDEHQ